MLPCLALCVLVLPCLALCVLVPPCLALDVLVLPFLAPCVLVLPQMFCRRASLEVSRPQAAGNERAWPSL